MIMCRDRFQWTIARKLTPLNGLCAPAVSEEAFQRSTEYTKEDQQRACSRPFASKCHAIESHPHAIRSVQRRLFDCYLT